MLPGGVLPRGYKWSGPLTRRRCATTGGGSWMLSPTPCTLGRIPSTDACPRWAPGPPRGSGCRGRTRGCASGDRGQQVTGARDRALQRLADCLRRLAADPIGGLDRALGGVAGERPDVGADLPRGLHAALDRLPRDPRHVATDVARRLHCTPRSRARDGTEIAADLLSGVQRALDRTLRHQAEVTADVGRRADRAAHGGDADRPDLGSDITRAAEPRHQGVLHEIQHPDRDNLPAGDRGRDRALDPPGFARPAVLPPPRCHRLVSLWIRVVRAYALRGADCSAMT